MSPDRLSALMFLYTAALAEMVALNKHEYCPIHRETAPSCGRQAHMGVTGDSLNGLVDSLRADGTIGWIGVCHEEVAAFAARAEAEIAGKLTVCAGSCGPGNIPLINGLYNCYRNHVPVLAIAADIPSSEQGSSYFQETGPKQLFSGCSVYCEKIPSPNQMPRVLETAICQAILQRSVSVVILPGDIALKPMPMAKL